MKAIPTEYKGISFRSKQEASYAKTLNEKKALGSGNRNKVFISCFS